ncbi:MmcQ/YjbR family DNA-binding protein [Campylobacter gastrosuis]|uniref:MmcQ/YjbR family DNA-binding protein n=1 Tax=Campylobacter gastrosuis TaxID=2974576 RepID=A0ABT7HLR5_9BACT|nr:MmcQ/YjbR family DNA-binding protein [Campylobacter gastrosuis]MDL0087909.1 MmcQ/YjbR family DNA-binding protein [Campylobacter gastrosuis]
MVDDILKFILIKYKTPPENIFVKHPSISVFRHIDTKKWYALLIYLKVGAKYDDVSLNNAMTLLNLKLPPGLVLLLTDNKSFLPAYHMNKKHWISVNLDSPALSKSLVFELIDKSYELTLNEADNANF